VGIRETINKNPAVSSGVVIALIVVALAAIVWELSPKHSGKLGVQIYFSDDDGKTFYEDSMTNIPPYQHNGNEGDIAKVYQVSGGTPFVGYLLKYNDEALANQSNPDYVMATGTLVKRPGDADWHPLDSSSGQDIVHHIKLPAGVSGTPLQVLPEDEAPPQQ
jgi:hypothetical protein